MSEFVYKVWDKKNECYCGSGLKRSSVAKFWTKKGHARSAISCQIRDKDSPRWKQYEIHEYELVRGMTLPAREEEAEPTMEQRLHDMFKETP